MFFGYARCPDVCPVTLAGLERSYKTLSDEQRRRVQVQLVTVDPVNDTPKVLRDYLDRFDPAFSGLTGSPDTINAAAKALFVSNVAPAADHSEHMQMQSQGTRPPSVPPTPPAFTATNCASSIRKASSYASTPTAR
ncbi:SCO family protein [Deinococcus radiodurans]|nr:SCO family protein [Deinococcus radiodurans]